MIITNNSLMSSMTQITFEQYEKLNPNFQCEIGGEKLIYCVPNQNTLWRAQTIETKEQDTVEWIKNFRKDCVFLDVGANVGVYTVLAAKVAGSYVYAIEPESQNFAILTKNIVVNKIQEQVTAYAIALSNITGFDELHLSDFLGGSSCHSYGEQVDFNLKPVQYGFHQGCYATTIDELVENGSVPCPTYVKIDVDGIEHKVINGANKTLDNENLKSILVELNTNLSKHRLVVAELESYGFELKKEKLSESIRKEGPFKGVGNHIFERG